MLLDALPVGRDQLLEFLSAGQPIQVGKRLPVAINELERVDAVAEAARRRALQRRSVQNERDSERVVRAVAHGLAGSLPQSTVALRDRSGLAVSLRVRGLLLIELVELLLQQPLVRQLSLVLGDERRRQAAA